MALLRSAIQGKGLESARNQEIYRSIAELPLLEWIQDRNATSITQAIYDICQPSLSMKELNLIWNEAWKQSS